MSDRLRRGTFRQMAEPPSPHGGASGPYVVSQRVEMTFYDSALELARAFGAPIMEPDFWPRDVGSISYGIVGTPKSGHYQVHAARAGAGVLVTGHRESDWQGRSPREWLHAAWREPDELKSLSGWIGWVGTPASLQAFVRSNGLGIQVFGFDTEDQVLAAISSLRLVVPN